MTRIEFADETLRKLDRYAGRRVVLLTYRTANVLRELTRGAAPPPGRPRSETRIIRSLSRPAEGGG